MDKTNDGERRIIIADQASLKDEDDGRISINLTNAFVQSGKESQKKNYDYATASFLRYTVPREDMNQAVYSVGPREMSSLDVRSEIRKKETNLSNNMDGESRRIITGALKLEDTLRSGTFQNNTDTMVTDLQDAVQSVRNMQHDRSLSIYRLEYFKKFSIPFGALSFVLAAVSIGLMANKSGQTVGFIIGIVIAAVYWALLLIGQDLGTRLGFSPFWSMWFPNVLAIAAGLGLTAVRISSR
jgi:lipopolysaccharide export system permease protein